MSKLRLLLSSDWEWVKLSPTVHLHCEFKRAAGQSKDSTESLAAISDLGLEEILEKSFDKTIIYNLDKLL